MCGVVTPVLSLQAAFWVENSPKMGSAPARGGGEKWRAMGDGGGFGVEKISKKIYKKIQKNIQKNIQKKTKKYIKKIQKKYKKNTKKKYKKKKWRFWGAKEPKTPKIRQGLKRERRKWQKKKQTDKKKGFFWVEKAGVEH